MSDAKQTERSLADRLEQKISYQLGFCYLLAGVGFWAGYAFDLDLLRAICLAGAIITFTAEMVGRAVSAFVLAAILRHLG